MSTAATFTTESLRLELERDTTLVGKFILETALVIPGDKLVARHGRVQCGYSLCTSVLVGDRPSAVIGRIHTHHRVDHKVLTKVLTNLAFSW